MPKTKIVNLNLKKIKDNLIADETIELVKDYLNSGNQILFFLNRRGYAPFVICKKCGYKHSCPNCSIYNSTGSKKCASCLKESTPVYNSNRGPKAKCEEKIDNICRKLTPTCPDFSKVACKYILCEQNDGQTTPTIRSDVCGKITSHTDWNNQ